MKRNIVWAGMLWIVAFLAISAVGATRASAQLCDPCPDWWVNVDYVFPPCTNPIHIDIDYADGSTYQFVIATDGHLTFPCALIPIIAVRVNGVDVPINGGPIWIPYDCDGMMPNMCLRTEARCNPCLEIKLHLEPCP